MLEKDYRQTRIRIVIVASILFFCLFVLGVRAFTAQVLEGEQHWKKSQQQTLGSIVIKPRRGPIYDRKMRVLTGNRQVPSLTAQPRLMDDGQRSTARDILIGTFGADFPNLKRLYQDRYFVWIERRMKPEQVERFHRRMELAEGENGDIPLSLVDEDKRYYPAGLLAAPILGFTDIDLEGRMGIEKRFNEDLAGSSLVVNGFRDPSGKKVSLESLDLSLEPPTGDSVVLTIDKSVQYVAERVIRKTVEEHLGSTGVAIVMDPNNGDILAMAQWPTFDPNDLSGVPMSRIHNYAIENTYEPGSTMKPFVIAEAIESSLYDPEDKIYCGFGELKVGKKTIHDSKRYGWLTLSEVLAKSSNICTAKIGMELGAEKVHETFTDFGFGQRSGIRLPTESRGIMNSADKWVPVDLANASFGQGVNVTPLQLATAMSVIANGGTLMQPRLVRKVMAVDGEVKKEFEPIKRERVISEKTAQQVAKMLASAVAEGGTGTAAQLDQCPVAGKTGTAEKLAKNHKFGKRYFWTSSFLGFLPVNDPKLVILVLVDEPRNGKYYGGDVAAPAFAEIAKEVAPMLGVCTRRADTFAEAL